MSYARGIKRNIFHALICDSATHWDSLTGTNSQSIRQVVLAKVNYSRHGRETVRRF